MGQASRSLSDFERDQQKMGGAATTTLGRMAQSAKLQQQEWQTLGRTLTVAGGAMTAVGAAALKTGIDYNSLRQMATKSLESVTGSAQAAAEQMDRLDSFGEDNWISRDVLVKAQQNMAGFGIEVENVIPYMDALSEAVAATSGSEQNFEALAQVMGKIQSQGKITARELNEFGIRGIDAAQMIGNAMGKTADQIRDEITAGTLDADTALDALAEGMATKFEGSSDRMRDTWDGAFKNLKAAWRDLAADFAKPLVDPEGGGFLVGLTNSIADFLNLIQKLPDPIKNTLGVLGGLGSLATLAAGGFMILAPQIANAIDAFNRLSKANPGLTTGLKDIGKSASIAAAGFVALSIVDSVMGDMLRHVSTVQQFETQLRLAGNSAAETSGSFDHLFNSQIDYFGGVKGHVEGMDAAIGNVTGKWGSYLSVQERLKAIVPGLSSDLKLSTEAVENMDNAMASLVQSGDFEAAAKGFQDAVESGDLHGKTVEEIAEVYPAYITALQAAAAEQGIALEGTQLYEAALGNLPPELKSVADAADEAAQQDELIGALEEVGIAADGTVESLGAYLDMLFETGLAAMSERDAHRRYQESLEDIGDAVDEIVEDHGGLSNALNKNKTDFDETTEAGRLAGDAFDALAEQGMDAAVAMAENGASQDEVQDALQDTYNDLINAAEQFGITGTAAEELAEEVLGVPDGVDIETWMDEVAQEKANELGTTIEGIPDGLQVITEMDDTARDKAFETGEAVDAITGYRKVDVAISEDGTAGQVQSKVNAITGKTEYVFVDDNGTTTEVQQQIVNIEGVNRTVYVDDDGTIYATQGDINGITGTSAGVDVTDNG